MIVGNTPIYGPPKNWAPLPTGYLDRVNSINLILSQPAPFLKVWAQVIGSQMPQRMARVVWCLRFWGSARGSRSLFIGRPIWWKFKQTLCLWTLIFVLACIGKGLRLEKSLHPLTGQLWFLELMIFCKVGHVQVPQVEPLMTHAPSFR
jgi:hypothetical protein